MRYQKESWAIVCFAPFILVFLLLAAEQAVCAAEGTDRLLRIPVFFITDRNLQTGKSGEVDFGPYRKYVDECKHDPFMGSAYCIVENLEGKQLSDRLKKLGWSNAESKDKLGDFKATPLTADSFDKIQHDFYKKVHEKALLTDDKNVIVFAHGYKNSFHGALGTAARLAYYTERPLIFYSWPSAARLSSYSNDENNVEWSQEHFNEFVSHLDQLCTDDPSVKIRMFAHSMGTRLVVRATPLLREKPYLIEGGLICPDIDDGLVKHYAMRYLSVNGTTEIRLYMSRRDKALALSQFLHGGYTRLGEQADAISGWVGRSFARQNAKTDKDSEATKASEAEFAERLNKTKKRMQTIDFTAIDRGLIGHNVPAKLISNMSYTNTPGPGLKLVPEESGRRSRMSNMFSRLAKLRGNDPSPPGAVLLVVKDHSFKNQSPDNAAAQTAP